LTQSIFPNTALKSPFTIRFPIILFSAQKRGENAGRVLANLAIRNLNCSLLNGKREVPLNGKRGVPLEVV